MNNKLLREELKRMSNLMGYDTSKTLTEQKKLAKNTADEIVTIIKGLFDDGAGTLVRTQDGRQYLNIVKKFDDIGETAPKSIVQLEELVNGNTWESFNTGFRSVEDFMESILSGSMTGGHKKSLLKIFLANTDDVAKNAGDILGDKSVRKALLDEINISPLGELDDISDFFFDVPYEKLDLPGHKELVKSLNRQLADVLKKMNLPPSAVGKTFKSVMGAIFSAKGAKYFLGSILIGYAIESIVGLWKDDTDDPIKETTHQRVKDAFSSTYWIDMTKNMSEIDQNKNLMSPTDLAEAYTEMTTQLAKWDNDPEATTAIYGKDSKIKTIIQASQFTQHYNTSGTGNDLVTDIADAMGISLMKGSINKMLLDLFGDETFLKVFKQIENLEISAGVKGKILTTTEEVLSEAYSNSPEYPPEQYDQNNVLWCSTFIPGQLIPTTVIADLSEWCISHNGCGSEVKEVDGKMQMTGNLQWRDRFQYIPVSVINKTHRKWVGGIDCFKVATQEDSYGDTICDGSLAKNTIDFDKGQFKAIIEDAIEKVKEEDE